VVGRLSGGPATVRELAVPFSMAFPSFLKHISVLEQSRLITCHKQGRVRTCTLDRESLTTAERWFTEQQQLWQDRFNNLDGLLAKMDKDNGS